MSITIDLGQAIHALSSWQAATGLKSSEESLASSAIPV
jgi:hypothetical protein